MRTIRLASNAGVVPLESIKRKTFLSTPGMLDLIHVSGTVGELLELDPLESKDVVHDGQEARLTGSIIFIPRNRFSLGPTEQPSEGFVSCKLVGSSSNRVSGDALCRTTL
jgi:hypothetical protein